MWVKNQIESRLLKVDNFLVDMNLVCTFNKKELITLGNYETNQRALEVLTEIQNTIDTLSDSESVKNICSIYKMPKI